jgi:PEP-CTERM motif
MQMRFWMPLWFGLVGTNLLAGTIQYQVTNLGANLFRYTYTVNGFSFGPNQELQVAFNPTLFGTLSNPVAGPGFSAFVFQPNNPPGAPGDYSAFTATGVATPTGPFSVDVTFLGTGVPGSQQFFINQYNPDLIFMQELASGTTQLVGQATIPEPGTLSLGVLGLIGGLWAVRRRTSGATRL